MIFQLCWLHLLPYLPWLDEESPEAWVCLHWLNACLGVLVARQEGSLLWTAKDFLLFQSVNHFYSESLPPTHTHILYAELPQSSCIQSHWLFTGARKHCRQTACRDFSSASGTETLRLQQERGFIKSSRIFFYFLRTQALVPLCQQKHQSWSVPLSSHIFLQGAGSSTICLVCSRQLQSRWLWSSHFRGSLETRILTFRPFEAWVHLIRSL